MKRKPFSRVELSILAKKHMKEENMSYKESYEAVSKLIDSQMYIPKKEKPKKPSFQEEFKKLTTNTSNKPK